MTTLGKFIAFWPFRHDTYDSSIWLAGGRTVDRGPCEFSSHSAPLVVGCTPRLRPEGLGQVVRGPRGAHHQKPTVLERPLQGEAEAAGEGNCWEVCGYPLSSG